MIYFDNAATSYPKPQSVPRMTMQAFSIYGANPGRSGYPMAMRTSEMVYRCREEISELFHAGGAEHVVFTQNCTHALNIAIKAAVGSYGHVLISDLEHNSVLRPLEALKAKGRCDFTVVRTSFTSDDETVAAFRAAIRADTTVLACTVASNVCGLRLPIERLSRMANKRGLTVVADAAQAAGLIPIDLADTPIDFLCMPGHKGLYGPTGTGVMIARNADGFDTLTEGGTGGNSLTPEMPDDLPDRFEAGTLDTVGIAGLCAGVRFVRQSGPEVLWKKEMALIGHLYDALCEIPGVLLYTERPTYGRYAPILLFNLVGKNSEDVASALGDRGIAVRAGLHCSPLAHRRLGTIDGGAVRVSPGAFNTNCHVCELIKAVKAIRH